MQTAVVSCFIAIFIAIATAPARADLIWGVNGHPLVAYPGVTIVQQLDLLKDLGLTSYRVDVRDAQAVAGLADLIAEGKMRGIQILPVLAPNVDLEKTPAEALYTLAFNFAANLISRFQADVRVWELGNEMENFAIIQPCEMQIDGKQYPCEWGPAGGVYPHEYFGPRWAKVSAVLKGLSDGAISVDPTVLKAMGTAGWGHLGAFELMKRDGIKWDISVWHMYGQDPETPFQTLKTYGKPIWVTEFNVPKNGQGNQAVNIGKTMQRLRELSATYRVEAAHFYELLDQTYWAPNGEWDMGLVELKKDEATGWKLGGKKPEYAVVKETVGAR